MSLEVPVSDQQSERNIHYYPWIDVLRAACFLMVFCNHFSQQFNIPTMVWLSRSGVSLFFVISGWLITKIIMRTLHQPGFIRTFYSRRFLRIAPVYFLVLLLYIGFAHFAPMDTQAKFMSDLPNLATFNYGLFPISARFFGHAWSISVEERFYMVWPILAVLATKLRVKLTYVLLAGLIVATFSLAPIPQSNDPGLIPFLPSSIIMGCLLALHDKELPKMAGRTQIIMAGAFFIMFFVSCSLWGAYHPFTAVLGMFCVWCCTLSQSIPVLLKPWTKFGELSYGLYLFHFFPLYFSTIIVSKLHVVTTPLNVAFLAVGVLAATSLLAWLASVGLEAPILKVRSWLTDKPRWSFACACIQFGLIPAGLIWHFLSRA